MPTLILTPRFTSDAQALWRAALQNAAWGSGLYGCDPLCVLDVLRYAAVRVGKFLSGRDVSS
jgi:hypothetical protein